MRATARFPELLPVLLVDRDLDRARRAYRARGVPDDAVRVVGPGAAPPGPWNVATDVAALGRVHGIDVVFEATGDMLLGAETALAAFAMGAHFVTGSCELDACLGPALAARAARAGVVYSNADGDQPVVLRRMLDEVVAWGFAPKVIGNCKGFLDVHQNPDGVVAHVPHHQDQRKVVAMADGSKQSEEMACLGNHLGFHPTRPDMLGPTVPKATLVRAFGELLELDRLDGPVMDFTQGIRGVDEGAGVFVVARRGDATTRDDMLFLKKGPGPDYLFFRDHHLCYFEVPQTLAQVGASGLPVFAPRGRFCDVIAFAKTDVAAGTRLDGLGGFHCYGVVDRARVVEREGLLPYGLAGFATTRAPLRADEPIRRVDVEVDDNAAVRLRREVEVMPTDVIVCPS